MDYFERDEFKKAMSALYKAANAVNESKLLIPELHAKPQGSDDEFRKKHKELASFIQMQSTKFQAAPLSPITPDVAKYLPSADRSSPTRLAEYYHSHEDKKSDIIFDDKQKESDEERESTVISYGVSPFFRSHTTILDSEWDGIVDKDETYFNWKDEVYDIEIDRDDASAIFSLSQTVTTQKSKDNNHTIASSMKTPETARHFRSLPSGNNKMISPIFPHSQEIPKKEMKEPEKEMFTAHVIPYESSDFGLDDFGLDELRIFY
ncbi:hypothetical protein ADUPG1_000155 [Aduncisulcus paluster]|uniref:Uncharacterized protein n=1 Tax=Aduncisulcus paluster TaxID=2918883 RepID=A0ABQ5K8T8_9EUKA|nr:hypothetical protein ADUPG1_000155 [Aduncisulcus paluster]